jgi:hypothetical protein
VKRGRLLLLVICHCNISEVKEQIHQRIRDNLRVSTDEIASEISKNRRKKPYKNCSDYTEQNFYSD